MDQSQELGQQYKVASKRSDLSPHVYATSAQAFKGLQTYQANQVRPSRVAVSACVCASHVPQI